MRCNKFRWTAKHDEILRKHSAKKESRQIAKMFGCSRETVNAYKRRLGLSSTKEKDSKCWDCQRACGGCEWSRKFEPVPGWKAKQTEVDGNISYRVIFCPLFVPDEKREVNQ